MTDQLPLAAERQVSMRWTRSWSVPWREGDVGAIYSDTKRSRDVLGWKAQRDLHEMMASAWKWEQQLAQEGQ